MIRLPFGHTAGPEGEKTGMLAHALVSIQPSVGVDAWSKILQNGQGQVTKKMLLIAQNRNNENVQFWSRLEM
jgi:hypothetical protein